MSKFMDYIVNLPVMNYIFSSAPGIILLNGWNNIWKSAGNATNKLSDLIPSQLDNLVLDPIANAFFWLDPKPPKRKLDPHLRKKGPMKNIERYRLQRIVDQNDGDVQLIDMSLRYDENLNELRNAGYYIESDHRAEMKRLEKAAAKEEREAARAYVEYEVVRKHEDRSPAAIKRDERMKNKKRVSRYKLTPEQARNIDLSKVDIIGIDDPI